MMITRNMVAAVVVSGLLAACSRSPDASTDGATVDAGGERAALDTPTPGIARTPAPAGAAVFIDLPKENDLVTNPVRVVFGLTGMTVAPVGAPVANGGHHHLLVDTELANPGAPIPTDAKHLHFGMGQTETTVELTPGSHTLQLVFADERHVPFDPVVASQKVNIVVR